MDDEEAIIMDEDNEQFLPPLPPKPSLPQTEYYPAAQKNETTWQKKNYIEYSAPPKRGIILSWKNTRKVSICLLINNYTFLFKNLCHFLWYSIVVTFQSMYHHIKIYPLDM